MLKTSDLIFQLKRILKIQYFINRNGKNRTASRDFLSKEFTLKILNCAQNSTNIFCINDLKIITWIVVWHININMGHVLKEHLKTILSID